jgi:hypothetical protein
MFDIQLEQNVYFGCILQLSLSHTVVYLAAHWSISTRVLLLSYDELFYLRDGNKGRLCNLRLPCSIVAVIVTNTIRVDAKCSVSTKVRQPDLRC